MAVCILLLCCAHERRCLPTSFPWLEAEALWLSPPASPARGPAAPARAFSTRGKPSRQPMLPSGERSGQRGGA